MPLLRRAIQSARRTWPGYRLVSARHLGVHGAYNFLLPDLPPGTVRDLRDPDGAEDDDEI